MFETLSTREVAGELVTTVGRLAVQICRLLHLIAEFDERRGWAGTGSRSCAHWLSCRAGLSPRTAREHVRVARSLRQLPAIADAFAAGRLSYSKVRALTRMATADDAEELLAVALRSTAAQLEDLARARRAGTTPDVARAGLRWRRAADGSLIVSATIPAEQSRAFLARMAGALAADDGSVSGAAAGDPVAAPAGSAAAAGSAPAPRAASPIRRSGPTRPNGSDDGSEAAVEGPPGTGTTRESDLAGRRLAALLALIVEGPGGMRVEGGAAPGRSRRRSGRAGPPPRPAPGARERGRGAARKPSRRSDRSRDAAVVPGPWSGTGAADGAGTTDGSAAHRPDASPPPPAWLGGSRGHRAPPGRRRGRGHRRPG